MIESKAALVSACICTTCLASIMLSLPFLYSKLSATQIDVQIRMAKLKKTSNIIRDGIKDNTSRSKRSGHQSAFSGFQQVHASNCSVCIQLTCPRGKPGPPGTDGKPGVKGLPGQKGKPGLDGLDVVAQMTTIQYPCVLCPPGPPGHRGVQGEMGQDGRPGPDGHDGEPGMDGPPGDQGDPGIDGKAGVQGDRGEKGLPGDDAIGGVGVKGPPGLPGARGPRGLQGANGLPSFSPGRLGVVGPQGVKGKGGKRGLPGPLGVRGPDGPAGQPGGYCPSSCSVQRLIGPSIVDIAQAQAGYGWHDVVTVTDDVLEDNSIDTNKIFTGLGPFPA